MSAAGSRGCSSDAALSFRCVLAQESESVFLDLLTYADLEALKTRKGRILPAANPKPANNKRFAPVWRFPVCWSGLPAVPAVPPPPLPAHVSSAVMFLDAEAPIRCRVLCVALTTRLRLAASGRYLILTYSAEFDRVHYPLPLMFDDSPNSDAMKQTIRRLRCAGPGNRACKRACHTEALLLQSLRNENCADPSFSSGPSWTPPAEAWAAAGEAAPATTAPARPGTLSQRRTPRFGGYSRRIRSCGARTPSSDRWPGAAPGTSARPPRTRTRGRSGETEIRWRCALEPLDLARTAGGVMSGLFPRPFSSCSSA